MKKKSKYYDYRFILSYNADISIVYGPRGIGKGYGAKVLVIKDFFKNGNQFIYIRRFETEIEEVKKNFLDDIDELLEREFPNKKGKIISLNNKLYYKEEDKEPLVMGHFYGLNREESLKSNSFPKVKTLIYDEFMTSKSYLKKEFWHFCSFLDTVFRTRQMRVLLLSNAVNSDNPFFEQFKITGKESNKEKDKMGIFCKVLNKEKDSDGVTHSFRVAIDDCAVQGENYKEETKTSPMALLAGVTEYGEYSRENKFAMDDERNVIGYPTGYYEARYNLMIEGENIGVYLYNGCYYFGDPIKNNVRNFCTSAEDAAKTGAYAVGSSWSNLRFMKQLFAADRCLYKNIKIKNLVVKLMRKLIRNY